MVLMRLLVFAIPSWPGHQGSVQQSADGPAGGGGTLRPSQLSFNAKHGRGETTFKVKHWQGEITNEVKHSVRDTRHSVKDTRCDSLSGHRRTGTSCPPTHIYDSRPSLKARWEVLSDVRRHTVHRTDSSNKGSVCGRQLFR